MEKKTKEEILTESQKIKRIITFGISAIAITATSMVLIKLASIMVQDIKKMQG
jgi:hypothetical protein